MLNKNTILLKRSLDSNTVPSLNSLSAGEIFVQVHDGKIYFKKNDGSSEKLVTVLNSDDYAYTLDKSLSSVVVNYGNNLSYQILSNILGGFNNLITGGVCTIVGGENNKITSDFSFIGSGLNNQINPTGNYSAILGGYNNKIIHENVFTLGSNLSSHSRDFTYVNNLSSQGFLYGDGRYLTGISLQNVQDSQVRSLTGNWQSTYSTVSSLSSNWSSVYTTVSSNSANWQTAYLSTTALNLSSGNWNTAFTNVQSNSSNWQTAYSYVSANSVNLTATNIFVNNNLTVTNTVSAKYYQGTLLDWMTLVRGYKTTPTLLATIGTGEVYTYVFATTGSDKTYYRYIATDGSEDSFYGNFVNPTLSNLVAKKAIIL
jgi:hypothetical protein